jgi:PPM family protein phosphatase
MAACRRFDPLRTGGPGTRAGVMSDNMKTTRSLDPAGAVTPTLPDLRLRFAARSERGVRPGNEDRYLVVRLDRSTTPLATNIEPEQLQFLSAQSAWALAVADGMGGHAAGEVASSMALALGLQLSQQGARWYVDIGETEARAERIIREVDREVAERAREEPGWSGMGTTLTAAVLHGDRAFLYHVGDSRAYVLRNGHLRRITRDHTIAQQLADARLIPPEHVGQHHSRHLLTQAMGRGDVTVEIHQLTLESGDRLLLASDGLTDKLAEDDLEALVAAGDVEAACSALVERGLGSGSQDNITVVVADIELQHPATM